MAANPPEPNEPDVIEFNLLGRGDLAAIKTFTAAVEGLGKHLAQFSTLDPGKRARAATAAAPRPVGGGAQSATPPTSAALDQINWTDADGKPMQNPYASRQEVKPVTPFRVKPSTPPNSKYNPGQEQMALPADAYNAPTTIPEPQRPMPEGFRPRTGPGYKAPPGIPPVQDYREYDTQQTEGAESSKPPKRRWDRTMQQASQALKMVHRSPLHGALQLAGGLATAKVAGELVGADGEEGGGLINSYLGSALAQSGHEGAPSSRPPGGGNGGTGSGGLGSSVREAINLGSTALLASRAIGNYGNNVAQQGTSMGYDPGAIASVGPFGMRTPFAQGDGALGLQGGGLGVSFLPQISPNLRQEIDRRWNIFRLRQKGGITGKQARQTFDALNAEGFSGQEAENAAFDNIAPLVQQGQDPRLATSLLVQAARNGNTSLAEMSRSLDSLGVSARNSRLTLEEYTKGLNQFSEVAEGLGATKGRGVALGRNISDSFGITPQQGPQLVQSPLVQAMAFQQHGIMPNAIGAADPTTVVKSTTSAVDMAWNMTKMFGRRTVDPLTGKQISQKDADANHYAQAAAIAGMDVETYMHLKRTGRRAVALSESQRVVSDFAGTVRTRDENLKQLAPIAVGSTATGQTQKEIDANKAENRRRAQARAEINNAPGLDFSNIGGALAHAAPGKAGVHSKERDAYFAQVRAISKMKDPAHQAYEARRLLSAQSKEDLKKDLPTAKLDLTPAAARLVRQLENDDPAKKDARRGGKSVNNDRTQPDQKQKQLSPGEGGYA